MRVGTGSLVGLILVLSGPVGLEAQSEAGAEDRIRPGDVIRLKIWREEELSGELTVASDGVVVFPRLGPYTVTDRDPEELRRQIVTDYQKYLRNPSIEVTFLKRVTILGAVREPGLYHIDPTMTVAEALAMAGGTLPENATNRIELVREGRTVETLAERTRIGESSVRSGDRLYVPERSWPSRNPGVVAALVSGLITVAVALLVR